MKKVSIFLFALCFNLSAFTQVSESDSLALVDFYHSLDGDNWDDNTNWLDGPVRDWEGVRVFNGRITSISLSNNGLQGKLPESFNDLDSLRGITVSYNDISGPLPKMDSLTKLSKFSFFGNRLNSEFPDVFKNMNNLQLLDLGDNGLIGTIPEWLADIKGLRSLVLITNDLEGDFFSVIGDMTQLTHLSLFGNNFSGPLPDFSNHQHLEELVLGNNDFTGPFPEWITQLRNLQYLHLGECKLSGKLPDNLFSRLNPELSNFVISSNALEGNLQDALDAPMTNITRFEISSNRFSGYIPNGIFDVQNIYRWSIHSNNLEGIPDFTNAQQTVVRFYSEKNKLGFEHLETCLNMEERSQNRIRLGPQKPLLEPEHLFPDMGDDIIISSGSGGMYSHYQWYKDSTPIAGANFIDYTISDYGPEDDGTYHCVITNDSFEFDLVRHPVKIGQIVRNRDIAKPTLEVFPNPFTSDIHISLDKGISLNQSVIHVFDEYGRPLITIQPAAHIVRLDIPQRTTPILFIRIEYGDHIIVKKVMRGP